MRNSRFLRATGNTAKLQGSSDLIHRQRVGLPEVLLTARLPFAEPASSARIEDAAPAKAFSFPSKEKLVSPTIKIASWPTPGQLQRQELPRQELPRQELPRQELPRQELPRQELPRQESARQEHPKQEPLRPPKPAAGTTYSERADILKRVATFKAHQDKLGRDREKYYEGMQTRIRATLGNQIKAKPL
jgi:hypothetical protein